MEEQRKREGTQEISSVGDGQAGPSSVRYSLLSAPYRIGWSNFERSTPIRAPASPPSVSAAT